MRHAVVHLSAILRPLQRIAPNSPALAFMLGRPIASATGRWHLRYPWPFHHPPPVYAICVLFTFRSKRDPYDKEITPYTTLFCKAFATASLLLFTCSFA